MVMIERVCDATEDDHGRHSSGDGMLDFKCASAINHALKGGAAGESQNERG